MKLLQNDIVKLILKFISLYIVSAIVAEAIIIITFIFYGIDFLSGEIPNNLLTQTAPYLGFIFFIIVTVIYVRFFEKRSLKSLGFSKNFILRYLKGFIIGILLVSVVLFVSLSIGAFTFNKFNEIKIGVTILLLIGFIFQGMAEEVMCRGFLMNSLLKKTTTFWAILISSVVFMIPHITSLMIIDNNIVIIIGVLNLLLFSIFVSFYMIKDNNIWTISAIHSSWNFMLGVVYGISVSGAEVSNSFFNLTPIKSKSIFNGGSYGVEAGVITTFILFLSILVIARLLNKKVF